MSSFKGSRKDMERELSSVAPSEADDPYWGRPVDAQDDGPLSMARPSDEHDSASDDVIPDLKLRQLFMHHVKDWVVIVLLFVFFVVLNVITPYKRYVGEFNINSVRFPHKDNTIPVWSVPLYCVGIPILVFLGYFIKRRDARDCHHAILGILTACLLTGVITDVLKLGVGRPRPDFFFRCFPDGSPVICHGNSADIKEGYKSFPSGHTSWSFAGLGYLSFYLAGKVVIFDKRGFTWRLSLVVLPILGAAVVAVSRVSDYWHHWQDVVVGGFLGLGVAYFCYKQHFPDFSDETSGYPHPHITFTIPLAPEVNRRGSHHNMQPRLNGNSAEKQNISSDGRANGISYDGRRARSFNGRVNGSYDLESGRL